MNELKPEDVMRSLEICAKPYIQNKVPKCKNCPYWERECHKEFIPAILALVRKKDAEIERLREMNDAIESGFETIKADTVRRMSERVKAHINRFYQEIILDSDIDKISREIMGE